MLEKDELGADTKASKSERSRSGVGGGLETDQGTEKGLGERLNKLFAGAV